MLLYARVQDIDVYDRDQGLASTSASRRHLAYDESEADDGDGGRFTNKLERLAARPKNDLKRTSKGSGGELFGNGAPVLPGFALGTQPVVDEQW